VNAERAPEQPTISGIDRALAGASSWDFANFEAAVTDWAKSHSSFLIEDVAEAVGLGIDDRCRWGAFTAALARRGLIVKVGYTPARRASRASGIVAIWRAPRPGER
jgi:hypothetical protein